MDKVGEEGEREVYGKSNIEIYNTMCKTDSQWEFAVRLRREAEGTGKSNRGSATG